MSQKILQKLEKFKALTDENKSSHWNYYLNNKSNYKNPYEALGFGAFRRKNILGNILHKILSRLIFNKNIFSSESYKKYQNVFNKSKRQIDVDTIRHIFTFELLKKKIIPSKLCVIGDGKANFIIGSLITYPESTIISINLTETLINDYMVLKEMNLIEDNQIQVIEDINNVIDKNKKLVLVPSHLKNFLINKNIELFVNIASFQEMSMNEISNYIKVIESNKGLFYCCNREYKKLIGGEELDLNFFPFGNGKKLFYENCEWHQKVYSYKYPFIKKYDGNHIHCLIDYKNTI